MAVRLLTSGWNTATENLSRFIEIISSNKWGYAMLLKGHHSRTRCNWYFEWTANIKSYEVSVLGCCKYVSQYRGIQGVQDILDTCAIKNHQQIA